MPLQPGSSQAAISRNIATERAAGKPEKQAMAIAMNTARGDADSEAEEYRKLVERYKSGETSPSPAVKVRMAELKAKLSPKHCLDSTLRLADEMYSRADAMARRDAGKQDYKNIKVGSKSVQEWDGKRWKEVDPSKPAKGPRETQTWNGKMWS